ncbi:RNA polymerase sigma factor SigJ [Arthrobacter gengyunqii]|uniref:RNA polymerase sigma factor SigJ n=1 Tax=Arthrobacter gengyunqii TaxID=2886940 RepID=A0A9X1M3U5_9MICC|nr:RNA polymerase sigma factor SigJ [Arthrobacter gengyunqii]MCC3270756.1 RNA polymerase sigma factor SigJ [Arthrobacter gengyunqii]UOY96632.1 RNA polymerase sigma factor SigJ [Arthrobacter gengyunqii]
MAQRPAENDGGADSGAGRTVNRDDDFLAHRGMVFTIAYDILGAVTDAEDVVQETYLRWRTVGEPVRNPRAYLARIATRQALNAVRSAARRREDYPGEWLPEPLRTGAGSTGPANATPETAALTAAEVSTAMLVVLQTLSGPERAAFILHDVFGFGYPEIAEALEAEQPAVRQLVHRARERVETGRPRTRPDPAEHRAAVGRFLEATLTGSLQALLDVLSPEVVLRSDGGGKASAALNPVVGPEKVARLMLGLASKYAAGALPEFVELNGLPAVAFREDGNVTTVFQLSLVNGRVQGVYAMRNPDKLVHLQSPAVG